VCVTGDMFDECTPHSDLSQHNDVSDDVIVDDETGHDDQLDNDNDDDDDDATVASTDEDTVNVLVPTQRQHSTTEYLPGMLHSNCPHGLLPKFPSWSILQLGEYSSYNPTTG